LGGEHLRKLLLCIYDLLIINPLRRPVECGQYTSLAFGERCRQMSVRPSMGTVGDAYDNAMAESFFASLEGELIERNSFQSKAQARMAVFTWIEGWYNPRRRHSGLGYLSPMNYERSHVALFDVVEDAHQRVEATPETV
jgi:putative transposase